MSSGKDSGLIDGRLLLQSLHDGKDKGDVIVTVTPPTFVWGALRGAEAFLLA
jgi:hypothetical protein